MKNIEELFIKLNETDFSPLEYGNLKKQIKVINGKMEFFDSKINYIEKFTIKYNNNRIDEVTFFINDRNIYLRDFKDLFGEYLFGYNFRDDLTAVSFLDYKGYKKVKNISLEFEGNNNEAIINNPIQSITFKL
ncbi:MAG: hypothetical protein IPI93_08170 [Sphingobacteriaceae bacterium]|nr:hypothetical protein [Sphingobacteriaceae bacterium]MBK7817507.1 hypothetical protein [Sphingobacteriaceae bacterium]